MPLIEQPVKLKHGAKSEVARQFGVTVQHISRVAQRERPARKEILRAIMRAAVKYEAEKFEHEPEAMAS